MVLSGMMECGKMMNQCMMNEIFQYTTKYNKSINPGLDQIQTVIIITNKHGKTTKENKKEKTKQNKIKYRRGSKTNKQRSETFLHVYKNI